MNKSVSLSVRIPEEDAQFIADFDCGGLGTLSDKVRSIIAHARVSHDEQDYKSQLRHFSQLLSPLLEEIKAQELSLNKHSDAVPIVVEWLIESMSYLLDSDQLETLDIEQIEEGLVERVFRLCDKILRMGVTETAPCYAPTLISARMQSLLELIQVIQTCRKAKKEHP